MYAPASAAALAVSGQEKELVPILEVPTPQKNMAGLAGLIPATIERIKDEHMPGIGILLGRRRITKVNFRIPHTVADATLCCHVRNRKNMNLCETQHNSLKSIYSQIAQSEHITRGAIIYIRNNGNPSE